MDVIGAEGSRRSKDSCLEALCRWELRDEPIDVQNAFVKECLAQQHKTTRSGLYLDPATEAIWDHLDVSERKGFEAAEKQIEANKKQRRIA